MSTLGRGLCTCLSRPQVLRPRPARWFSLTSHRCRRSGKSSDADGEDLSQPIKFSTSKASHREWKVERSMGSRFQRPWWRVLPLSVFGIGFLIWCGFRRESDIDRSLEKELYEHLPSLLTNYEEEEEEEETKMVKDEVKKDPDGSKTS